jgi:cell division protein FtsA
MAKYQISCALDLGTSSIKVLVAKREKKERVFEVVKLEKFHSFGLRKGAVENVTEVAKNIRNAIFEINQGMDQKIDSLFVNINGPRIKFLTSSGLISVSRADQKISSEDVERVIKASQAINLPSNYEVLESLPQEFIVDGERGIKKALGLSGIRLEVKTGLITVFSQDLKNLTQAVLEAGCQIEDIFVSPLVSARAVLLPQEKELGVALIDIGATTTGLAVFEEDTLIHLAILPVGSANITNDIAIGLRTKIETAENIKKQFGFCQSKKTKGKQRKKVEVVEEGENSFSVNQNLLNQIIKYRVNELFDLVAKELKKISKWGLLPAGVVLTGGGANLKNIKEAAREILKLPSRIGIPKEIIGLTPDPTFSVVSGLILEGEKFEEEEKLAGEGIGSKIKNFFRIFLP